MLLQLYISFGTQGNLRICFHSDRCDTITRKSEGEENGSKEK